jgi:hypothetical protein
MNTEKSIEGNFKELIKLYTICFTIYFLAINFIFQITNSLSLLLNVVLVLIPITLIVARLSVPNKLADNYPDTCKLKYLFNKQNNKSTSLF